MSGSDAITGRAAAARHAQRAAGQVAALAAMIRASEPFAEVAQQLLAARGSLDSLLVRLVELELSDCLPTGRTREEVDGLLRTALRRTAPARRVSQPHPAPAPERSPAHPEGRISS